MAQKKRVLLLCGDYVEDSEVIVPFHALQAYGVTVDAVCPGKKAGDICRTSIHEFNRAEQPGHNFTLNATFDEIEPQNYDGLVIPGARSPEYLAVIPSVVELTSHFANSGKVIAALCHGPLILAAAGAINGRKLTAFPTLRPVLVAAGADWVEPEAKSSTMTVVDGNLITAVTYKGHPEYIRHLVKALGGNITISSASHKKILFLCGDYMEDYEATVPFQTLEALGCHVDAVSPGKKAGDSCRTVVIDFKEGEQNYSVKAGYDFPVNADYDDVDAATYDALVIPGGRSPAYLAVNDSVIALVKHFMDSNKPVASIGQAQQILAAANVLKGRKCTAHPVAKLHVVLAGATWQEPSPMDRCFSDGNLVSGATWMGLPDFISQLMGLLGLHVSF